MILILKFLVSRLCKYPKIYVYQNFTLYFNKFQVRHDVNQLNSCAGNLYNNPNMGGSGSHIDDNVSMSNMNHTLAAANGTSVRDGFLSSPDLQ